jgi:hypothetical protein
MKIGIILETKEYEKAWNDSGLFYPFIVFPKK